MNKKDTILLAALKLFSRNGFKDTSIAELSRLTGAAEGTIFHHFRNKEDIFLHILDDARQTISDEFNRFSRQKVFISGLDMVIQGVSFYLELAAGMEDQFLIIQRHYPYKLAETNPDCRKNLEAVYNCVLAFFETAVKRGQKDGSIREISPRKAALLLYSLVDGVVRFNTYHLYHGGALYEDLMDVCERMLSHTSDTAVELTRQWHERRFSGGIERK
ncbi:MAG: TetR/AcrR family transcriptional regulator [Desulfobacteraceae bacterium]|nr:TetR/AcrR family transcriptional regulator [Desulfobacteraceae bacterium]